MDTNIQTTTCDRDLAAGIPANGSMEATLPRLLMISNFLPARYGTRAVQQDMCERLEPLGFTITAASSFRSGLLRGGHMVLSTVWNRGSYDVAVVDVYSGRAFVWADAVSRVLSAVGRPFVLVLHGGNLPRYALRHPERVTKCLARAAVVVAPSRFLQEQMRPYRAGIGLIANGIDLTHYPFRPRTTPTARLMWLRALHSTYNPAMAVRVVEALSHRYPDAHLTLVGPDKMDGTLAQVHETVSALGVTDRVHVAGPIDKGDVPAWLDKGDIFINTTNTDNTPISVLEAMACGLPVVSTDVGGLPYLLDDGHDALLVPKGDDKAMAAAICRLIDEPELAARLARNARAKVETFDWSNVVPRWADTLTDTWRTYAR